MCNGTNTNRFYLNTPTAITISASNVPHLHFGVRVNNTWKNPIDYINASIHNEGVNRSISTPCDE